jgi:hypothetical protein
LGSGASVTLGAFDGLFGLFAPIRLTSKRTDYMRGGSLMIPPKMGTAEHDRQTALFAVT